MSRDARRFLILAHYLLALALVAVACCEAEGQAGRLNSSSFVVYPKDCNHQGTLFGGKTLAEMDRVAGIAVRRFLYASKAKGVRAVTASADGVKFYEPGRVGDLILVTADVRGVTDKSVTVLARVWVELRGGTPCLIACGTFVFVSVGADGKSVPHGAKLKGCG